LKVVVKSTPPCAVSQAREVAARSGLWIGMDLILFGSVPLVSSDSGM
jgi:hypothetical protein